jgi:hypothetical protein
VCTLTTVQCGTIHLNLERIQFVITSERTPSVDSKPRILMYSQDASGLGYLRRTLELAKAFVEHDPGLSVLILTGSTVSRSPTPG